VTAELFMVACDGAPAGRDPAVKTAAGLPVRPLSVAPGAAAMDPPVLDYYATRFSGRDEYLEMLVLNAQTPDETVERLTRGADEKITEIVAQNQLRMLRHANIVRALVNNKNTRPSTVDNICDFCVRSAMVLEDLPAFRAARKRIHGGASGDEELAKQVTLKQQQEQAAAEAALEQMGAH